uniref:DM10 domain-containing protein n=1 Tax=Parascaris equorum TaxID=6256 RepID=A0A914S2A0_PAREQ
MSLAWFFPHPRSINIEFLKNDRFLIDYIGDVHSEPERDRIRQHKGIFIRGQFYERGSILQRSFNFIYIQCNRRFSTPYLFFKNLKHSRKTCNAARNAAERWPW